MSDLSLDEIADRIIDAILEERHINRESLTRVIRPVLKIWVKHTNKGKEARKSLPVYLKTIEDRNMQMEFWRAKVRKLVTENQLQEYYEELNGLMNK